MSAVIVLQQMLVLFSMIAIGVFLWKKNWIDVKGQKALSKMVVNIFNPLLLIYSISGYDFEKSTMKVGQNMIFVIVYFLLLFLLGFVVAFLLRLKKPQKNFYQMMMLFSNIGFVGIPIVSALLGREYVLYIAFYTLVYNVLLYTYGIYLAIKSNVDEGGTSVSFPIKRILNPGVVGCVIAILIFLCRLDIPAPVETFLDYMGNTCIPLSMILIGISVGQMELSKVFSNLKMYVFLAIKMLLIPIGAALICKQLPVDAGVYKVFVIECAVPIGSIITLNMVQKTIVQRSERS